MDFFGDRLGQETIVDDQGEGGLLFQSFKLYLFKLDAEDREKLKNIDRTIHGFEDSTKDIDGHTYISVSAAVRYIFQYSKKSTSCGKIGRHILCLLLSKSLQNTSSCHPTDIIDIYRMVAKTDFKHPTIAKTMMENITIHDSNILTLYEIHKPHFTDKEWQKICIFENHFSMSYGSQPKSHPVEVKRRNEFLELCIQAQKIGKEWSQISKKAMQSRQSRMNASDLEQKVQFSGDKLHLHEIIDQDLSSEIQLYLPDVLLNAVSVASQTNYIDVMCMS
jgi:hypothetical protein